jgi:hypothetical protein
LTHGDWGCTLRDATNLIPQELTMRLSRAFFALALIAFAGPASGAPPSFSTLQPGGFRTIGQTLPVNIVFVGYESGSGPRDIQAAAFQGQLPSSYRVKNRYPAFYGLPADLGLAFTYSYRIVYAGSAFENAFFAYLAGIAQSRPLTAYQAFYNSQTKRSLTVANNSWIDAPAVEKWLADHAGPMLGVNTQQYTVFFINWYGRPDFKFHVYTKTNEPDPDTTYNFGAARESRKAIAWGGTAANDPNDGDGKLRRVWFYDLSAGPEYWTANFNVDNADVDGDSVLDYRMPPVWEYGNTTAYRPFTDLSGDLGKVARYVAIDLLFTASPLYKPAISPPDLPEALQLDVNMFDEGALNSTPLLQRAMLAANLGRLQPLKSFSTEVTRYSLAGRISQVFYCFLNGPSCFGKRLFGDSFGDLFLYANDHLNQYLEGDGDYELPIFTFNTAPAGGLLGFADDNWRDGTQSFVFGFLDALSRPFYGFTTTLIHEAGHHLAMSHPHDGYDYEKNVDFGPSGPYHFAWSGDESASMMSYIDLNWDFSQFDQDSMNRYLVAVYVNEANEVLAKILKSPRASQVMAQLSSADGDATAALAAYASMNYPLAASKAKSAYSKTMASAKAINVHIEPQAWQADYRSKGRSFKFIDPVDYHRMAP